MPGRLTSINTRSGRKAAATTTASSPLFAQPATWKPSVASTTAAAVRRNDTESSTMRTRILSTSPLSPHPAESAEGAGRTTQAGNRPPPGRSAAGLQEGQHGDHPAVHVALGRQPQFGEHSADVLLDCALAQIHAARDRRVPAS